MRDRPFTRFTTSGLLLFLNQNIAYSLVVVDIRSCFLVHLLFSLLVRIILGFLQVCVASSLPLEHGTKAKLVRSGLPLRSQQRSNAGNKNCVRSLDEQRKHQGTPRRFLHNRLSKRINLDIPSTAPFEPQLISGVHNHSICVARSALVSVIRIEEGQ
jgi:hypothetical protein